MQLKCPYSTITVTYPRNRSLMMFSLRTSHRFGYMATTINGEQCEPMAQMKNSAQAIAESNQPEPLIAIKTYRDDSFAVIEISDNGPGMDDDQLKRVFEPFYTTKQTGSGTGLGLSVSYFIITSNHNGSITAESISGEGATFTVKLPFKK